MRSHHWILAGGAVGIAALLLTTEPVSARRWNRHESIPASSPPSAQTMTISVHDNYFQPPILQIAPGTTVRWVNHGHPKHTVTTQDGRDYQLAPGASIALTFYSPGRLQYYCRFHPLVRMEGAILVGAQ